MSVVYVTSGTIMDNAAATLNDVAKQLYPYTTQLSFLNMALREAEKAYERANMPVTDAIPATISVPSGTSLLEYGIAGQLPNDLIEIQLMWESPTGQNNWIPMTKLDSLPIYMEGSEINQLLYWVWESQKVKFLPANANNDIRIEYTRSLFPTIVDENAVINVVNVQSFLEYRTASLCARFIGENATRADELDVFASMAIDDAMGIGTKGRQAITIRRRPFRASYKARG